MKKTSLFFTVNIILATSLILINSCRVEYKTDDYLLKVLGNLEKIKSATYFSKMTGNFPMDTLEFRTSSYFKKEFVNPADTFIGAAFAWFNNEDTSKMYLFYDGNAKISFYDDTKDISIDSFKTSSLPFRPIPEPFFQRARSLIDYALNTDDTIVTDVVDFGDSIKLSLYVPGKVVYFFGRPYAPDIPYLSQDEKYSKFEMWINKSDDLPYKIKSKYFFGSDIETYNNVEYNKIKLKDFVPARYFPPDYKILETGKNQVKTNDLTGKKAPDWILTDSENNTLALKEIKSKVIMIEFMGIGCAPCHAAIPFLKQLTLDYKNEDFILISIETWRQDVEALKRYKDNNKLNYRTLVSTDTVKKIYNAEAVPVFYIIDKERIVKKVIIGYGKETTDKEIIEAINELI